MRLDELEKNQPQFNVGDIVVVQDEIDAHNGEQGTVEFGTKGRLKNKDVWNVN
jgi:hypothetical protein